MITEDVAADLDLPVVTRRIYPGCWIGFGVSGRTCARVGLGGLTRRGIEALVVGGVEREGRADLAEIADAGGAAGGVADFGDASDDDGGEDADYGDDGQQLDEGKGAGAGTHGRRRLSVFPRGN